MINLIYVWELWGNFIKHNIDSFEEKKKLQFFLLNYITHNLIAWHCLVTWLIGQQVLLLKFLLIGP